MGRPKFDFHAVTDALARGSYLLLNCDASLGLEAVLLAERAVHIPAAGDGAPQEQQSTDDRSRDDRCSFCPPSPAAMLIGVVVVVARVPRDADAHGLLGQTVHGAPRGPIGQSRPTWSLTSKAGEFS